MRSLTVASDGSLVVAANNKGVCYVWRLQRGMQTTAHFEPLHKLQARQVASHEPYTLSCADPCSMPPVAIPHLA